MTLRPFAMHVCRPVALSCFACFVCSGCATLPLPDESSQIASEPFVSALQMRAELARDWNLRGEVIAHYRQHEARIKFVWRQRPDRYQLRIASVSGMTLAVIDTQADGETTAMDARGNRYRTATARQMVEQLLGFELPVEHLRYWVLGVPSPHSAYRAARREGDRLVSFRQQGWQVRYRADEADSASPPYVKRLEMTSGDMRATVNLQPRVARNRQVL